MARSLITAKSWDALWELAKRGAGHVWLVEGVDGEAGFVIGAALAHHMVEDANFGSDVHLARPEGDRWALEGIDSHIIGAGRVLPVGSWRVVVVGWGDTLGVAGADHLLKTFEDCGPGTRYVLVVKRADSLPATIRGRVTNSVHIEMAGSQERMASMIEAGGDAEMLREIFGLCGSHVTWVALGLASPDTMDDLRKVLGGKVDLTNPITCAGEVAAAIERIAKAQGGDARITKRELVREQLDVLEERVVRVLRKSADAVTFARRLAEIDAISWGRRAVDIYVAPQDVLRVVYVRLALAGQDEAARRAEKNANRVARTGSASDTGPLRTVTS